jgi:hypothetical protein
MVRAERRKSFSPKKGTKKVKKYFTVKTLWLGEREMKKWTKPKKSPFQTFSLFC